MCDIEDDNYSSELGTQEYWDKVYTEELQNFRSHGDVGEVWFGEDSALRVLSWLKSSSLVKPDDPVVDLGCGNGMQLIELAREGFTDLTGMDYSKHAVDLATELASKAGCSIQYLTCDILSDVADSVGKFSIALDKGTFDAVSLDPDDSRRKRKTYVENVSHILKDRGLLVITSCNWTESELVEQFSERFKLLEVIPTPSFKFGGKVGNLVTTVVFRKGV